MTNMVRYDLKERILLFVLTIIKLLKDLPQTQVNRVFIDQIARSASSIGSNYEEADGTPTKKDFIYKMGVVKKEAKETRYWLILIKNTNPSLSQKIEALLEENEQLIKIFSTIIIKSSHNV